MVWPIMSVEACSRAIELLLVRAGGLPFAVTWNIRTYNSGTTNVPRGTFVRTMSDRRTGRASSFLFLRGRSVLQCNRDRAQHVTGGSGFAGPDFELARGLLHKHFYSGNDRDSLGAGDAQQMSLNWVIDHIEDDARLNLFVLERTIARISHPDRRGIDDDVEGDLVQVGSFYGVRLGLAGKFLSFDRGAIQNPDFGSALFSA